MKGALLEWEARWPPLEPVFAVARGVVAVTLARQLLAAPARLAALRGVVAPKLLAVTGSELPWVDGVEYFGRDGAAAWLLVPTHRRPRVPTSWLERRYRTALPEAHWPCLLLAPPASPHPEAVRLVAGSALLPVGRAADVDPGRLEAWCDRG